MGFQDVSWKKGLYAASWSVIAICGIAGAQAQISIEAQPLGDALQRLSGEAGIPVLYAEAAVAGRGSRPVLSAASPRDAVDAMLEGSGLVAVSGPGNGFVIREGEAPPEAPDNSPDRPADVETLPLEPEGAPEEEETAMRIGPVTVTGTSLRGIAPESSPLDVYGRDDIARSGAVSAEQFVRTLPQNFDGGSTEFAPIGFPGDSASQRNNTYATGANLRGLGAGATLTLLDGNRLAPTSTVGEFVDLSLIPVSAIERVEVLSDGASSIYGGDAVAGVINFVLRDDFEGAETSLRYGTASQGGLTEYRVSQAVGAGWESGNLLAIYEFLDRDRLSLADRPSIAAPSLLGGGEVPDTGPVDLLPAQDRHSALLSFRQAIGSRLDLSSTLLYSDRQVAGSNVGIATFTTVSRDRVKSETLSASFGADYTFSDRWALAFDANYSQLRNGRRFQVVLPDLLDPAISSTDSKLWSAGLLINGDVFALPGGMVKASVGTQFRREDFELANAGSPLQRAAKRDVSALYGEVFIPVIGEQNALPGVRRLELNLSGRVDDYSDFGSTSNPKAGLLWAVSEKFRLRSSWSTSFTPPTLGQVGARDRVAGVIPYD
ncbi:TonB-dependent receptor domain-containing protein, partial [Henriciella sp.]|uniref:TonB-dependent receptor domain-containing protein n=1 Tax=Henriciella sp. TaxID=1968823 RepID=UPI003C78E95E